MGQNSYETKNLYLAGFLMARSHPLRGQEAEQDSSGRKSVRFFFPDTPKIHTDILSYQNNGRVKIGEYTRCINTLKSVIRDTWGLPEHHKEGKNGTKRSHRTSTK